MEQQTPIPPKSRMKVREGQKRAIFPSLIWGGGGGLGFPFILSKIVAWFQGHSDVGASHTTLRCPLIYSFPLVKVVVMDYMLSCCL